MEGKEGWSGSAFHGGGKWAGKEKPLATMAKARAMHHSAPDTVKVANAMKKPLDPRPRPRGETYQSCMEPRAPSPNSMEVEYYWNRTPVITPKPKPAPPKLSDCVVKRLPEEVPKVIGRPLKKEEWKPPVPPKTQPYVGVKIPGAGEVARRAPLRPLPYGPIAKPNPFEDVGREAGEG